MKLFELAPRWYGLVKSGILRGDVYLLVGLGDTIGWRGPYIWLAARGRVGLVPLRTVMGYQIRQGSAMRSVFAIEVFSGGKTVHEPYQVYIRIRGMILSILSG